MYLRLMLLLFYLLFKIVKFIGVEKFGKCYSRTATYNFYCQFKELYGEDTLFPDGMETFPKRFAISKQNGRMILHSDIAVCYVHKITGGTAKFREKAENKGLRVINIQ